MFGFGKKKAAKKVAVEVEDPNIDPIEKMVIYPKDATEEEKAKRYMYAKLLYEGTQRMKEMGLDDIEIRTPNSNI